MSLTFWKIAFPEMKSDQNPGYSQYIWDYTIRLYRDYSRPLQGSL